MGEPRRGRRREEEPELTARPLDSEESEALIVDSFSSGGERFIRGGVRRVRPGQEDRELDLDKAPIAALFDDPEEVSNG